MSTQHILINKNTTNITNTRWLVSARLFIGAFIILCALLFSSITTAKEQPSFDCNKATTEVEKIICSDEELSKLDVEMNKWYNAFMKTLDDDYYRNKLKKKQIDWLGYRGKLSCFTDDYNKKRICLKNAYQRRIENLNAWTIRKDYDFFIDYSDYYEQSEIVGYRKKMGKFISKLGEEYYVECKKGIIIPKFPEETIYFENYPGPLPYMNSYVEIIYQDEDFIYFRCEEIQEAKEDQSLTKFSIDMINDNITYDKLKVYPKNEYNKDIIQFINKKSNQNNNIDTIKLTKNEKMLSAEMCMELWNELKNNNYTVIPYISATSPFELKEKANFNCTHEQFYKLAKNKYGKYLHLTPPFQVYNIDKKTYLISNEYTTSREICQVDIKKCQCKIHQSLASHNEGIMIEIQNKFYFIQYSKFMDETLSLTQISEERMKEDYLQKSCIFTFKGNN